MKLITLLAILSITVTSIFAQPGSLDLTFNDSGKVYVPGFGIVRASALQKDGKILVGGESYSNTFLISRYMPDGTIDASFGENGIVISKGFTVAGIYTLTVLPNGKILASGYGYTSPGFKNKSPLLAQYLPNGTLDPSFGKGGTVALDLSTLDGMVATTMAVMDDGRIVQAGSSGSAMNNTSATAIIRYLPDGTPDVSFNYDGIYTLPVGPLPTIKSLAVQRDGKIILGGEYSSGSAGNFYITRVTPDGTLDSSFGINGKRNLNFYGNEDKINALALQPDGKILAAGSVDKNGISTPVMTLVRFRPDGFFDSSFGINGIIFTNFDTMVSAIYSIVLQADGKIVAGGIASTPVNFEPAASYFALAKFNPNGSLDNSFGNGGKTTTVTDGYYSWIPSIALQADNKIIAAGQATPIDNSEPYWNLALARYNNSGSPIAKKIKKLLKWWYNHNNNGVTLNWPGTGGGYYAVQRSSNVTGSASAWSTLARVNAGSGVQAGNLQTYSYTDNNPQPGTNYYRIQQADANGTAETSNVVAVTINASNNISVSPNPVKDMLYIKGLNATTIYSLQIVNAQGNTAAKAAVKNATTYKLNLQRLNKGVYYLKLICDNSTTTSKFVKE